MSQLKSQRRFFYRLSKKRHVRLLRDSRWQQWVILAAFFVIGVLTAAIGTLGSMLTGLCLILLGPLLAWPFPWSGYGYQIPKNRWWKGITTRRRVRRHGSIDGLIAVKPCDFKGVIATLYDIEANTDTLFFTWDGYIHASSDIPERFASDRQIELALRTTISLVAKNVRIAFIGGSRPRDIRGWREDTINRFLHDDFKCPPSELSRIRLEDPERYLSYLRSLLENNELELEDGQAESIAADNLDYIWENAADNNRQCFNLLLVRLKRPYIWSKLDKHPESLTDKQLSNSDLVRSFRAITQGLGQAGFTNPRLLTFEEVQDYAFRLWNVRTVKQAQEAGYAPDRQSNLPQDSTQPSPLPVDEFTPGQDTLKTDGCEHAFFVTQRFGDNEVPPGGLEIMQTSYRGSQLVAVVAHTGSPKRERFFLRKRSQLQRLETANRTNLEDADIERMDEATQAINALHWSKSKPIRFNQFFMISTPFDDVDSPLRDFVSHQQVLDNNMKLVKSPQAVEDAYYAFMDMRT